MLKVKFIIPAAVFLVIVSSDLSSARRPYFSDEDEAMEETPEEQQEETSLGSQTRLARRLHPAHTLASKRTEEADQGVDEDLESSPSPAESRYESLRRIEEESIRSEQERNEANSLYERPSDEPVACTCGIFMTGQFDKVNKTPPKGNPIVMTEMEETFQCSAAGKKLCTNKCLEILIKHLPNSPALICAASDRDIHKERAYLFVKNCEDEWHNSNLSAGREYCCKDNEILKCPSS